MKVPCLLEHTIHSMHIAAEHRREPAQHIAVTKRFPHYAQNPHAILRTSLNVVKESPRISAGRSTILWAVAVEILCTQAQLGQQMTCTFVGKKRECSAAEAQFTPSMAAFLAARLWGGCERKAVVANQAPQVAAPSLTST